MVQPSLIVLPNHNRYIQLGKVLMPSQQPALHLYTMLHLCQPVQSWYNFRHPTQCRFYYL